MSSNVSPDDRTDDRTFSAGGRSYDGAVDIAPLTPAHHEDAMALWRAVGLTRPWNDPDEDLRRAVRGPASTVLAGLDRAGGLVATAMVGHDGHRGWVYYLAVAPELRGRGLARSMMHACERWVSERGIPKIQLMVRRDNEAAANFYEHLGYESSDVTVLARRLTE